MATSTERSKKFREHLKADPDRWAAYLEKEKIQNKKRRQKKRQLLTKTPASRKALKEKRLKDNARQKRCRQSKPTGQRNIDTTPCGSYQSEQSFGKAVQRVRRNLPNSPRKREAVIIKLCKQENISPLCTKKKKVCDGESSLAKIHYSEIKAFFERDDISRQAPGKRDFITIKKAGGSIQIQKRHMFLTIGEAYALFKKEFDTVKVGRSTFFSLRPRHVLPSSQMPHNVCVCKYHSNMDYLFKGLSNTGTEISANNLILESVCSEQSEECMTGSCDKCIPIETIMKSAISDS